VSFKGKDSMILVQICDEAPEIQRILAKVCLDTTLLEIID
jgi:hypothetical protein